VSSSDAVSWSPDGRFAVSGGYDKTLRLWAIAFAKQPVPLVASMAFAANSAVYRRLIQLARDAVTGDPAVAAGYLQQARQQPGCSQREDALEQARALSHCLAHRGFVGGWEKRTFHDEQNAFVHSASWSPDARYVLEASSDNRLRLWDVFSGGCLRIFEGHTEWLNSVSWSPDSLYALSGSRDNTLRLWEVSSGKCLRIFEGHTSDVNSVSLSPDGLYALSGSEDGTVRLWEVSSGQCLRTLEGHTSGVESVSWRPDGGYVLSASEDGTVRLWEVSSGKCLRTLEGHQDVVKSVSWSPDSRNALSGSCDETLRLWEVSSGKCLRVLEGHASWVNSVSWSPDGRYALSAGSDRTLRLWDVLSGECLRIFEGHARWVNSVSWSPNGRFALSASEDATVRLWELDWEFEANQPADWDEGARSFLSAFLTVHTPYADGLFRRGKPSWTDEDFRRLLDQLGCGGYGWLRPEGVRRELEKMAADWQGPPALV
jgi:WD40 repeat protein